MKNILIYVFLLGCCFKSLTVCSTEDVTLQVGTTGEEVVLTVVNKIDYYFDFINDFHFLERLAYAETHYGDIKDNFNFKGGIWNISLAIHNELYNFEQLGDTSDTCLPQIQEYFNTTCYFCNTNYSEPFKSGIAARLYLEIKLGRLGVPVALDHQAQIWSEIYHVGNNTINYMTQISILQGRFRCNKKIDLWFLLDASNAVTKNQFISNKESIKWIASRFHFTRVHFGFSVFANEHKAYLHFKDSPETLIQLISVIDSVTQPGTNESNLDWALYDIVQNEFNEAEGGRKLEEVARVLLIVTNSETRKDVDAAIRLAADSKIAILAIGLDENVSIETLNKLATDPNSRNVYKFNENTDLQTFDFQSILFKDICTASIEPYNPVTGEITEEIITKIPIYPTQIVECTKSVVDPTIAAVAGICTFIVIFGIGFIYLRRLQIRRGRSPAEIQEEENRKKRKIAAKELKRLTALARKSPSSESTLLLLENQLDISEQLEVNDKDIDNGRDVADGIRKTKAERAKVSEELLRLIQLGESPNPPSNIVQLLEDQLILANKSKVKDADIARGRQILEVLKKKDQHKATVLDDLRKATASANLPTASKSTLELLQKQIHLAETEEIDSDDINKAKEALDSLEKKLDQIRQIENELERLTTIAKQPDPSSDTVQLLEDQIRLANNVNANPELIKSGKNALNALKGKLSKKEGVAAELKRLTEIANQPNSPLTTIQLLEDQLEIAVKENVNEEDINRGKEALQTLKDRADERNKIVEELRKLTQVATESNPPINTVQLLENQISLACDVNADTDDVNNGTNALNKLKEWLSQKEKVTAELQRLTSVASEDDPPFVTIELLEKQLSSANSFYVDSLHISNGKQALDLLKLKYAKKDEVKKELQRVEKIARESDPSDEIVELLNNQIALAIQANVNIEAINSAKEAIMELQEKLAQKEQIATELRRLTDVAKQPNAPFETIDLLEKQLEIGIRVKVDESDIINGRQALESLKQREAERQSVAEELIRLTHLAFKPAVASISTLNLLENQIELASEKKVDTNTITNGEKALEMLKEKDQMVKQLKLELESALTTMTHEKIQDAVDKADTIENLFGWNSKDTELEDLMTRARKALEGEDQETVNRRNELREKLIAAKSSGAERMVLKQLIIDFEGTYTSRPIEPNDKKLIAESKELFVAKTKSFLLSQLKPAIIDRDLDALIPAVKAADKALSEDLTEDQVDDELRENIERAKSLVALYTELQRMRDLVATMRQTQISEIHSYSSPPELIKKVMKATLLLLGEKASELKSWKQMNILIGKLGAKSIRNRVTTRKTEDITPREALRAKEEIEGLVTDEIEAISHATAVFFAWSGCIIQEVLETNR